MAVTRRIIQQLFDVLLFTNSSMQWYLSRPLLSVFLVDESSMQRYAQNLCVNQNEETVQEIVEVFEELSKSADRSLETWSRDTFAITLNKLVKRLTKFSIQHNEAA